MSDEIELKEEDIAGAAEGETAPARRKPTPAEWDEACLRYEMGEMRTPAIAEKLGVTASAVSQQFNRRGVVYGSKKRAMEEAAKRATEKVITEAATGGIADRLAKIEETKKAHYESARFLANMTMKIVSETVKAGHAISTRMNDFKAIRQISAIMEINRRERYILLDAQAHIDENELPTIEVLDLGAAEIEQLRNTDDDALDLGDEEVTLPGEDEDTAVVTESE